MVDDEPIFSTIVPSEDQFVMGRVRQLLAQAGLGYDDDIEVMVIGRVGLDVVACMGLAKNVLKCAAVRPDMKGRNLAARLVEELTYIALDKGRAHLFLFTKPRNREMFEGLGFYRLAEVANKAILMENTPTGIQHYMADLAQTRVDKPKVAGIVVNANPFTKGHQFLIQTAARQMDFVHVFVVREDVSLFSYADRLALVRAGIDELPERSRILVHEGSDYIVSRATFPSYFLKDKADLATAATGLDLQLFRNYIAPALAIRHRYIGTEPASAITNLYNSDMQYWLQQAPLPGAPIEVHVLRRAGLPGVDFISATKVRSLMADHNMVELERLVPAPTFDLIRDKYMGLEHAGSAR